MEPFYDRVFDIGTTFEIHDGVVTRQFMVENFIAESGGFAGGVGASDLPKFKAYIQEKYQYDLTELETATRSIL